MKKIYALILLSLIAICNIAFGQYDGKLDTLEMMSELNYEEASELLSGFEYTEDYDMNEFVSSDGLYSYILDTVDYIQVPSLITVYSKRHEKAIKESMLLRGVITEKYKDEDNADCYYYESVIREYLLVVDKRNKIIILTTAKF